MSRFTITLTSIILSCFVTSSYGMDDLTEKEKIIQQKMKTFKQEMTGKSLDALEKKRQELQIQDFNIMKKRTHQNNFFLSEDDKARLNLNMDFAQIINDLAMNFYK